MPHLNVNPEIARPFIDSTKRYVPRMLKRMTDTNGQIDPGKVTKDNAKDLFDTLTTFMGVAGNSVSAEEFQQFYIRDVEMSCALGFLPPHIADNFKNWQRLTAPTLDFATFEETREDARDTVSEFIDFLRDSTDWDGDDAEFEDFNLACYDFINEGYFTELHTVPSALRTPEVFKIHRFDSTARTDWIDGCFLVLQDARANVLDVVFQENGESGKMLKASKDWEE